MSHLCFRVEDDYEEAILVIPWSEKDSLKAERYIRIAKSIMASHPEISYYGFSAGTAKIYESNEKMRGIWKDAFGVDAFNHQYFALLKRLPKIATIKKLHVADASLKLEVTESGAWFSFDDGASVRATESFSIEKNPKLFQRSIT